MGAPRSEGDCRYFASDSAGRHVKARLAPRAVHAKETRRSGLFVARATKQNDHVDEQNYRGRDSENKQPRLLFANYCHNALLDKPHRVTFAVRENYSPNSVAENGGKQALTHYRPRFAVINTLTDNDGEGLRCHPLDAHHQQGRRATRRGNCGRYLQYRMHDRANGRIEYHDTLP